MKLTAMRSSHELQWSVLEIETEEWERQMAALDVAAAANGFPVTAQPARPQDASDEGVAGWTAFPRLFTRRAWPWLAAAAVALFLLAAVAGYAVWRMAQQGVAQIQGDVANAVHLETVKDRVKLPDRHIADGVETVDLIGNAAMAHVVITSTLPSGALHVSRELRFYTQTATGWQQTEPVAAFWGPADSLDTAHLHFTFGALDRAAVEQIAPTVETLYAGLMLATGQKLTPTGQLTIEIVPRQLAQGVAFDGSRLQVTSPVLLKPVTVSKERILAWLLNYGMCEPMLTAALRAKSIKPQWQPLAESFDCLLIAQATLAQARTPAALPTAATASAEPGHAQLDSLLYWASSAGVVTAGQVNGGAQSEVDNSRENYAFTASQVRRLAAATSSTSSPPRMASTPSRACSRALANTTTGRPSRLLSSGFPPPISKELGAPLLMLSRRIISCSAPSRPCGRGSETCSEMTAVPVPMMAYYRGRAPRPALGRPGPAFPRLVPSPTKS